MERIIRTLNETNWVARYDRGDGICGQPIEALAISNDESSNKYIIIKTPNSYFGKYVWCFMRFDIVNGFITPSGAPYVVPAPTLESAIREYNLTVTLYPPICNINFISSYITNKCDKYNVNEDGEIAFEEKLI